MLTPLLSLLLTTIVVHDSKQTSEADQILSFGDLKKFLHRESINGLHKVVLSHKMSLGVDW